MGKPGNDSADPRASMMAANSERRHRGKVRIHRSLLERRHSFSKRLVVKTRGGYYDQKTKARLLEHFKTQFEVGRG